MEKELTEMTLEELWKLFPIFLVAPESRWKTDYEEMKKYLKSLLSGYPVTRISHIGSTAINGIRAKDIVDILIEIPLSSSMDDVARTIEKSGFIKMSAKETRVSFNKGYTKKGFAERVYHVHLRYSGDNDELYFRDYLNDHPQVAEEYENLKLELWKRYEYDRDAYTEAKTAFVGKWTEVAKADYSGRYAVI